MYCMHCGAQISDQDDYCTTCGARRGSPPERRLFAGSDSGAAVATMPGEGPFGDVRWSLRDVFFGLLCFVVLFLVVNTLLSLPAFVIYGDDSAAAYGWALIVGGAVSLTFVAIAANFTFMKYGGGWASLGLERPRSWSVLWWGLAALVSAYVLAFAYALIVEVLDFSALQSECDDQIPDVIIETPELLAIAAVVTVLIAPVTEEVFFRGFIFGGLARHWRLALAVIASAAIFALPHIVPTVLPPIFMIGLVLAFFYYRSGNLLSTIFAHFVFNAVSFAGIATCDTDGSIFSSIAPFVGAIR